MHTKFLRVFIFLPDFLSVFIISPKVMNLDVTLKW